MLALPDAMPDRERVARDWLSRMELADAADQLPAELSGGMCRRVALARALAYGGDILLLDEPFNGLDDALRSRVAVYIKNAAPLIVLVTHDEAEAALFDAQSISLENINQK